MRIELRSDSVVLDGYVNVCSRESRVLPSPRGRFVEEIKPRTFERALMKNDAIDLLFNHDRSRKLGSTKEGNLELREDNVGLRAIAVVTDPQVMDKARRGELRGWSFGFSVLKDEWRTREDGMQKRTVEDIDLYEISVLDKTPAYIATSIEARGEEESTLTETRAEEFRAKVEDTAKDKDKTEKTAKPKDKEEEEENEDSKEDSKKDSKEDSKKDSKKDSKEDKKEERLNPKPYYFEHLEKELTLLQLKGGN